LRTESEAAPRHRAIRLLLILLGYNTQSWAVGMVALYLPLICAQVDVTYSQAGTIALASTLAYSLMQVPAGYLGDRYGVRRVLITGLAGLNLVTMLVAFCDSYVILLADQVILGFFRGMTFATGLAMATAEFEQNRRATAMSYVFATSFLVMSILNLFAPILETLMGWRDATLVVGGTGLCLVAALWRFGPRGNPVALNVQGLAATVRNLAGQSAVWLVSFVQFSRLAVASSLSFWLPTYLMESTGVALGVAGALVAAANLVSLTAGVVGATLADRLGRPTQVLTTSVALLMASLVGLAVSGPPTLILCYVYGMAFLMHAYTGVLFDLGIQVAEGVDPKSINGFTNLWANLGALTFVYLTGLTRDLSGGFTVAWGLMALLCGGALAASLALGRVGQPAHEIAG
jgi:DHA1 family inner membrane transport protein